MEGGKLKTIVIVGCAKYLSRLPLELLNDMDTIACNRILLQDKFRPKRLVVADRRPYIPELKSGRLAWAAKNGIEVFLSSTLWDPKISCADTPVQRRPKFKFTEFRVHGSRGPMNWKTLKKSINSFANTGLSLLQLAVILGAKRIGMTGVGIVPAVEKQQGHVYGNTAGEDSWGQKQSGPNCERACRRAKRELDKMGVQVFNLSLESGVLESIFGRYDFRRFVRETR